jgi:hypothetical protein
MIAAAVFQQSMPKVVKNTTKRVKPVTKSTKLKKTGK